MTSTATALPVQLTDFRDTINLMLPEFVGNIGTGETANYAELTRLQEACTYSLSNGGKRARPLLLCGAALAVNPDISADILYAPAAAVEMIHSYSLVHDDLPAMDDDDLRRGKPASHRVFGEAMAILAGDGLQTRAIELLTHAPGLSSGQRLNLVATLTQAAGNSGMVGGQAIDIQRVDKPTTLEALKNMHELKTGALILATLRMGGICAGATGQQLDALATFGAATGLGFQVVDDILDVQGSAATLGKTSGKDALANKPTYVSLLGMEQARQYAEELHREAQQALSVFGIQAEPLAALSDYLINRNY